MINQILLNHRGTNGALSWFVDNVHQGVLCGKYGRKKHKFRDISTIDKGTGLNRVSKCPEQARELEFFGFQRDHVGTEVLEAKNIVKRAKNHQKHLNF